MLVATRNIRGFNRPLKQKSVRTLVHNHKIDVFGILKSKLDKKDLSSLMKIRKCNFLKQEDKCTKFFHDLIKRNNKEMLLLL